MDKYRDQNGNCRYCSAAPGVHHWSTCPITRTMLQNRGIALEALDETQRQLSKWNIQNLPLGNGPDQTFGAYGGKAADMERILRDRTDRKSKQGTCTYFDVLFEEVFEAYAAGSIEEARKELIQVIAVGISAVASLDRNGR